MLTANWPRTYSVSRDGIASSIYPAVFRPTGEEFKSASALWGPRSFGLWRRVVGLVVSNVSKDPWKVNTQLLRKHGNLRNVRTLSPNITLWGLMSFRLWCRVVGLVVSNVSKDPWKVNTLSCFETSGPYHPTSRYEDSCLLGCDAVLLG